MTSRINVNAIRKLLGEHKDGLSISSIVKITGIDARAVQRAVACMADVYVDRWEPDSNGRGWVVVYCLMEKPPMPPKPSVKPSLYFAGVRA